MKTVQFCMSYPPNNKATPEKLPNLYTPRDTMASYVCIHQFFASVTLLNFRQNALQSIMKFSEFSIIVLVACKAFKFASSLFHLLFNIGGLNAPGTSSTALA